jgi:hypothetical protein
MNYREIHREKLRGYLSTITFDGQALTVSAYSKSKSSIYPYVFLMALDSPDQNLMSNQTYRRQYNYAVSIVFQIDENESDQLILEKSIDVLESLILDKLQTEDVRSSSGEDSWEDLQVGDVTSPYSGDRINLDQNLVIKTIEVKIYQLHDRE